MKWPITCVDNFFDNPDEIVKFANTCEYEKPNDGKWPGRRTKPLHLIDFNFFKKVITKIISLIYPMQTYNVQLIANSYFQKIKGSDYVNEGWVHDDRGMEFTSIIYLTKDNNCGTSIFKGKNFNVYPINEHKKREKYANLNNISGATEKIYLKQNNDQFKKTCSFTSEYNRIVNFDSHNFHAVDNYGNNDESERLSLITFFEDVYFPKIKFPITEMKRII